MTTQTTCRTAVSVAVLVLALATAYGTACADSWVSYRTGICSTENEYAEFRLSGFWVGDPPADFDRRIPELPLSAVWGRRGVEHSWRCDLSTDKTITVRYTMEGNDLSATVWVNQARLLTESFPLFREEYGDTVFFPYISLDAEGLKICREEKRCEAVAWDAMPRQKDPAYKAGWAFGESPRLKLSPMRIRSGKQHPVCQKLFERLATDSLSNLSYWLFHEDSPIALSLSKASKFTGQLKTGMHSFDIDNDGIAEKVYMGNTSGNWAINYYVVINTKEIPERTKVYLEKRQHFLNFARDFPAEAGTALIYFKDNKENVTFPIESDGKNYLYVRVFDPEAKVSREDRDAVTHAVYEYKQSGKLETVCEFCASYMCYDE